MKILLTPIGTHGDVHPFIGLGIELTRRGHDVTGYTLACFGGAGGQHACQVADALGMTRIFIHPLAGVLSAYGMGLADQSLIRTQAVEQELTPALRPSLLALAARLRDEATAARSGELAPALVLKVVLASLARGEPVLPCGEDREEADSSGKVTGASSSSLSMRRHEPGPENGRGYGPVGSNHEILLY